MNHNKLIWGAALSMLSALNAHAEDWDLAFRFQSTQQSGAAATARNANSGCGAMLEGSRPLGEGRLALGFGYVQMPGNQVVVSRYSRMIPATNPQMNPSVYESRLRMTEAGGFQVGAVYRVEVLTEGFYVQGGLRLGFYKTTQKDAGTRLITNGKAVDSSKPTDPNIIAVQTIASVTDKRTVSPEAVAGVGYSFGKRYALELNVSNNRLATPQGTSTGLGSDVVLSVRF